MTNSEPQPTMPLSKTLPFSFVGVRAPWEVLTQQPSLPRGAISRCSSSSSPLVGSEMPAVPDLPRVTCAPSMGKRSLRPSS